MEILIEIVIEILFELLLQFVVEILLELGVHGLENFKKSSHKRNPIISFFGYLLWGILLGLISTIVFPGFLLLTNIYSIVANLIVTPVLSGGMMFLIGKYRRRRGLRTVRLETFWFGYVFALAFALVRFFIIFN